MSVCPLESERGELSDCSVEEAVSLRLQKLIERGGHSTQLGEPGGSRVQYAWFCNGMSALIRPLHESSLGHSDQRGSC